MSSVSLFSIEPSRYQTAKTVAKLYWSNQPLV